tara:strand:- start:47 stop:625 length:579 start_codon:yes stop_codon:yes gene_type:complete
VSQVHSLFSVPILEERLDHPVEEIELLCQQERSKNSDTFINSNLGGWQSGNISYPDSPFFFLQDIERICQEVAKDTLKINKSVSLSNAWININQKHNSNQTHTHPNGILSGVYYIKTPAGCGSIEFLHPAIDMMERDWDGIVSDSDFNKYNSRGWWLPPKEGILYIFPSWLKHFVNSNMSDEERISISFNVR